MADRRSLDKAHMSRTSCEQTTAVTCCDDLACGPGIHLLAVGRESGNIVYVIQG